ncbi:MAG: TetR/AcrR family transcriptional regulator [Planctomycetota bacterium]
MPRLTSEHFVDRTSELLREQGGGDVSLSMVLEACGAQKGSLYHFFPGGKEELVAAAVKKMHACAASHIRQCIEETQSTAGGVRKHLLHISRLIDRPDGTLGMPFLALAATIGETNKCVHAACVSAVKEIETLLAGELVSEGFESREAKRLAGFAIAAIDGSILNARVQGSSRPVKLAADMIAELFSR